MQYEKVYRSLIYRSLKIENVASLGCDIHLCKHSSILEKVFIKRVSNTITDEHL